jgi:hypothetical protein
MAALLIRINPATIALVNVEALYVNEEIESLVKEYLISAFAQIHCETISSDCQHLITTLHRLFLQNGDSDQDRSRYGASPHSWYMSSCEISILQLRMINEINYSIEFCHVGQLCVYLQKHQAREILRITPMHNVTEELSRETIEQSCLAPFASRSNHEIAGQLLAQSPKLIPNLAQMERKKFCIAIGHVRTRAIGFFQDSSRLEPGYYRPEPPVADSGIFPDIIPGDKLLIYLPETRDLIPYQSHQLKNKIVRLDQETRDIIQPFSLTKDSIVLEKGQLVSVEVTTDGVFGSIFIKGI